MTNAILIKIAPQQQTTKARIRLIYFAIVVCILFCQCSKAIRRSAPRCKRGSITKKFATTIDRVITVSIYDYKSVIAFNPARSGFNAFAGVIEEDGFGGIDANSF